MKKQCMAFVLAAAVAAGPAFAAEKNAVDMAERLEWFRDQKLGLMMHFGLYSQIGILESWTLAKEPWSRGEIDWTKDMDFYKKQYRALNKSFNPVRLDAGRWADAAKAGGFKYLIFTSKHHDGFCLFDTATTDYKTTAPECPFSTHRHADVVRHVFDEFRAKGIPVMPYFSKADWNSTDYWKTLGIGSEPNRNPDYKPADEPERWKRFCDFTKAQILELATNYGRIEGLWLDGGWLNKKDGTDMGIGEMVEAAREKQPWIISFDRWCGGPYEQVKTPEQTVPKKPLDEPWESCITMGRYWGWHYDDSYKSARYLIHMFVDIVAKGGNLALNVGPQPDGRLPKPALERMAAMGKWLEKNGEAIYATRPLAPWRKGEWAFTRNRHTDAEFAIRLWKDGEAKGGKSLLPAENPAGVKRVVHIATGKSIPFAVKNGGVELDFGKKFDGADEYADTFRICR